MILKTLIVTLASTILGAAPAFAGDCGVAVDPGNAAHCVPEIGADGSLAAIAAVAALAAIIVERHRRRA